MIRKRSGKGWKFYLLEFLIVFISVSGAFWLDSVKEDRQERENQIKYYETFVMNLELGASKSKTLQQRIDDILDELDSDPDAMPGPNPNLQFINNQLIIRSAFEESNFKVITPQYLRNLDEGSNLITLIQWRLEQLELKTQEFILTDRYETESFREWYIDELHAVSQLLQMLDGAIIDGALPETRKLLESLR